jgi:hypothetical protein
MEMGLIVFFATLSASFCIAYLAVFKKLRQAHTALTALFVENEGLKEAISKINIGLDNSTDNIHKENFIKFLSDSRDWAFDYIESSQKTIEEVSKELKKMGLEEYSEKLTKLLPDNK